MDYRRNIRPTRQLIDPGVDHYYTVFVFDTVLLQYTVIQSK